MTEQFTFFYGGPFSQWYRGYTFIIDGIKYNCAEQFMMAQKALLFSDRRAYREIIKAKHPKDQKAWGRIIEGFEKDRWNEVAKEIVFRGNYAKFSQNPDLKKELLATTGTTLVEASPIDQIWGIGMRSSDPRAKNRNKWNGTNWLGEVLTAVREKIDG